MSNTNLGNSEQQKSGKFDFTSIYFAKSSREDVEICCRISMNPFSMKIPVRFMNVMILWAMKLELKNFTLKNLNCLQVKMVKMSFTNSSKIKGFFES